MKRGLLLVGVLGLLSLGSGRTQAAVISSSQYSLTSITGSYAYGQTDWNDVAGAGFVNNVTDVGTVNTLLSNGYVPSPPGGTVNGIYNWLPGGFHALTFAFNGGQDYILNSLSFISSRNYGNTPIVIEYSLNGGPWLTAAATTSNTLGITTGAANTYTINLGGVQADAFRFTTNGGDQVSLHEISLEGAPAAVPEPATYAVFGALTLGGFGYARRRLKVAPVA